MTDSPNLGLPLIEAAQAQKHVTHNEALALLDALTQIAVTNMAATSAPEAPANGVRVIVGAGATGAFAGHANKIAFFDAGDWRFAAPRPGWIVWSSADACAFVFAGAVWTKLENTIAQLQNLALLGVATSADAANPLSMRGANALFTARYGADGGTGDLRFKLNKEGAAQTVSQLYQSNWSGRAETGLVGNDSWTVRRSPDGNDWTTALVVDPAQVDVPAGAAAAPGLSFIGDEDTGVYRPNPNQLAIATGGVGRVVVTEAGNVVPAAHSLYSLGAAGMRWFQVFASVSVETSTVVATSRYEGGFPSQGYAQLAFGDGDMWFRGRNNTELGRIIFAVTNAAGVSLKRSGAALQVRNGNDTAFATIQSETFETQGSQARYRVGRRDNNGEAGVIYSASGALQFRLTATNTDVLTLATSGVSIFSGPAQLPSYTVATLPSAALGDGMNAFVTDSNQTLAAGLGTTVAAGGANYAPVHSRGGAWRIG